MAYSASEARRRRHPQPRPQCQECHHVLNRNRGSLRENCPRAASLIRRKSAGAPTPASTLTSAPVTGGVALANAMASPAGSRPSDDTSDNRVNHPEWHHASSSRRIGPQNDAVSACSSLASSRIRKLDRQFCTRLNELDRPRASNSPGRSSSARAVVPPFACPMMSRWIPNVTRFERATNQGLTHHPCGSSPRSRLAEQLNKRRRVALARKAPEPNFGKPHPARVQPLKISTAILAAAR